MALPSFSSTLTRDCKKRKISVREKAFADLLLMGWIESDAYIVSGLFNEVYSLELNMRNMKQLMNDNPNFVGYMNSRTDQLKKEEKARIKEVQDKFSTDTDEVRYRNKEEVLNALAATVVDLKGKEKADVLMKIADLQQMKKDEIVEEEKKVHFYLPLTCHQCQLYLKSKKR
jgi:cell division protein FtsX